MCHELFYEEVLFYVGATQDEDQIVVSTVELHHFAKDTLHTQTSTQSEREIEERHRSLPSRLPGQDEKSIFVEQLKQNFILVLKNSMLIR